MGCYCLTKICKVSIIIFLAFTIWSCYQIFQVPELPNLEKNPWWGPGKPTAENAEIIPFKISIPQEDVDDLKLRLSLPLRLTPSVENSNFTYGFNAEVLRLISYYWKNTYDWRERERRLNTFPQFKTQIEGLDIHFVHVKPTEESAKNKVVRPLLLIHGWPGSFVEFDEIIPMLTAPMEGSDIIFEVIVPSLPGYMFSQGASKSGLGGLETAQIFLKLMTRLGFSKFYVQGGDWGSMVATYMATLYPDHVIGVHVNMMMVNSMGNNLKYLLGSYLPSGTIFDPVDESVFYPISSFYSNLVRETGYMHIQATKPDTIGSALNDSPLGLAAYLLEKFSTWTHKENHFKPDGALLSKNFPISMDRLLDNVSLYWFTSCITTSMRYYFENIPRLFVLRMDEIPTNVPAGFSAFKQEIFNHPESFLTTKHTNLISYVRHPVGGHFAAMEQPSLLSKDINQFVSKVEKWTDQEKKNEL